MILASKKWNVHTDKYPNFERGSKGCAIQILHTWSKCFAIDQNYEQSLFQEAIKTEHHEVNWWIKRTKWFICWVESICQISHHCANEVKGHNLGRTAWNYVQNISTQAL